MGPRIHEFVDEGLGHSSYLVELGDGTAAVIDPPRFPVAHEQLCERLGLRLAWTADTHSHADYVTGSPGLASRVGATFVAPKASRLITKHRAVDDGERVALRASVTLVALATPGHTPDHHAYLLESAGEPVALFTGGSLMVGTVGRTDLCGPDLAVPLAHDMFRSLRRFDPLPDALPVYPTHGAGSFCSAPGSGDRTTTLGRERAVNPMLLVDGEDVFVERLVSGFGTFPAYFARLPEINRLGPTSINTVPALASLDVNSVADHLHAGAVLVDARPIAEFGAGSIPGSLSNALRPVFGSWLGWLVPADTSLVFVLEPGQNRTELVRQCLDVGHEHLLGELDGGVDAWAASGRALSSIPLVDTAGPGAAVFDVRQANEYAAGHVPRTRNIELGILAADPPHVGQPVMVMCGHGERAMTGASILARHGASVTVFDGGPATWADTTGGTLDTGP
jgi:hydroxyacylglutathione hydrolase